ncbi:MAG: hypothetical protein KZQ63_11750 [Candidatus Thiodiazotropha sp. (ex Lucinoma aequizonata)]|nr:hypothetical protein [Candidatus Thiodiazotropha sp. (ex Lucinoma aequizonata)]MCU7899695.1 hypothetical protein [Candidatus Thiodiazotropha sp. (ex Lucinoma aequizonata)]MCU7912635.1 hypothetical protein [Candidatus Thiodiazotropha sp. (ex Lucinoma aequizonata)]
MSKDKQQCHPEAHLKNGTNADSLPPLISGIVIDLKQYIDNLFADTWKNKRVFDLVKDLGTSQSSKIDSIFDSLLCPDRPAYVTIPYCTSTASCSCTTPS